MSQQIQELLDKIKIEGVEAANTKAQSIEAEARKRADEIIAKAKKDAEAAVAQAKSEIKKMEEATHSALKHASRNAILSLKKEIQDLLHKVVQKQVSDSLTAEQTSHIIEGILKKFVEHGHTEIDIHVALSPHDLETLKHGIIAKFQKQAKSGIVFKGSEDISKGFIISFDAGKSSFDFTDRSLAEYLGSYLNSQMAALVKESV